MRWADELANAGYRTRSPGQPLGSRYDPIDSFPASPRETIVLLSPQSNLPSPCHFASGLMLQLQVPDAVANPMAYESHTLGRRRLELTNQRLEPQKEGGYSTL